MDRNDEISLLNGLIETTIDSVDGYEKAAEVADRPDIKSLFAECAAERRQVLQSLRSQATALGGTPEDDGSLLAAAHRTFIDIASAFENNSEAAVEAVETGEDYIRGKFEDAVRKDGVSAETRAVVEAARREITEKERLSDRLAAALD